MENEIIEIRQSDMLTAINRAGGHPNLHRQAVPT